MLNDISHKILKTLMFRMSLLNLINFINIILIIKKCKLIKFDKRWALTVVEELRRCVGRERRSADRQHPWLVTDFCSAALVASQVVAIGIRKHGLKEREGLETRVQLEVFVWELGYVSGVGRMELSCLTIWSPCRY